jgi:hypothetical protein
MMHRSKNSLELSRGNRWSVAVSRLTMTLVESSVHRMVLDVQHSRVERATVISSNIVNGSHVLKGDVTATERQRM